MRATSTLTLLLLILSASAHGQDEPNPPTIQRDPQGLLLLSQALTQMGGAHKAQIKDVKLDGTLANPDKPDQATGTFVAKARGFDLSMETVVGTDTTSYRVLNSIGTLRTNGKTKRLPPNHTAGLSLDMIPVLARWTEFLDVRDSVRDLGLTDLNGKSCRLIEVETPSDRDRRKQNELGKAVVLIDPVTGLIAAVRVNVPIGPFVSMTAPVETRYSDYKQTESVFVPMTVEKIVNGQMVRIMRVIAVHFNSGLADTDFIN